MKKILLAILFLGVIFFGINHLNNAVQEKDVEYQKQITHMESNYIKELAEKEKLIERLEKQITEKKESEKVYTIVAGGDIMMDRGVEAKIKKLEKDYNFPFEFITEYLKSADYVFANLEGSLSNVGKDRGSKYSFRFDIPVAKALSQAGINLVSLANNHILDWGRDSLCATPKNLADAKIASIGAGCNERQAERAEIVNFGNTKVAFLAYTEFYKGAQATETKPGISNYNLVKIKDRIKSLKSEKVDLIMVSMHWGEEYKDRAPKRIVKIAQELIDAGVDVIIGHHPHVDQEIERYGKGWVIYSLGNFVFDQSWSKNTMEGLLAEIKIQNGRVYDIIPKKISLNKNYQPKLAK